jgi:putative cardiolipin synthase
MPVRNYRDIDVFTSGPITRQISKNFDTYWNCDESFPINTINLPPPDAKTIEKLNEGRRQYWQMMLESPLGKRLNRMPLPREVRNGDVSLIWAQAELAADNPDKIDRPSETAVSIPGTRIDQMASNAQNEFIVFSPYFVPLGVGV